MEEVPHFFGFTKNDFVADWPGMPNLDYDPFPAKKLEDVVRNEIIARKLVLRATLRGGVLDIHPGVRVTIDGQDFAVTSAKIAINAKDDQECTSEIEGEHFLTPPEPLKVLAKWRSQEDIYRDDRAYVAPITDLSVELKRYFAKHPEKLHDLAPRKFEELIADILKDLGWDTELTSATRDGGRDIYAYLRNQVTSFLMFVNVRGGRRIIKLALTLSSAYMGSRRSKVPINP